MEWIEISAKTIEEAKDRALDALGVDERDAEFDILEEPKAGLFGRVKGEARIRARVKPRKPRSKQRRDSRKPQREKSSRPAREAKPRKQRESVERREKKVSEESAAVRTPREEVVVPLDEQAKIATDFLAGFVDAVGVQAEVASVIKAEDEILEVSINGDQLGLLIGPRGQTMTSLQEFVRIVVQRKTGATNGRIILDVSGYRARRKEALSQFANQIAQEVIESGRAKVLEPMNPADRKIVHDTINDIDGVETSSEGVEPRRRVVISPADGATTEPAEENATA